MFGVVHLVWWVLLVVAVVVPIRRLTSFGSGTRRPDDDRALSILKERYARGEIDNAEFDARKRDLV